MQKLDIEDITSVLINKDQGNDAVTIILSDFDYEENIIEDSLDVKNIFYIEKMIRGSYEYKAYIKYLKNELNLTTCAVMPGLDANELGISLEFHHAPFTLFDITKAMLNRLNASDPPRTVYASDVAEAVMREHFKGNVGLIPLTSTMHEMAHNKAIRIPIDKIHGNFHRFIIENRDFLDKDILTDVEFALASNDPLSDIDFNKKKTIVKRTLYQIESD